MKLKQQITLLISLALLVPSVLISSIAISKIKSQVTSDIEFYRVDEMNKLKMYIKHITDIAYGVVEVNYKQMQDSLASIDSTVSADVLKKQMLDKCLTTLSQIRFDKGEGYFWVTDNKLPYPTMLMHAEKKNLKGVVLDDPKHNVERNTNRNIYQVRSELCNAKGEAYVEYSMKKPGSSEVVNKLSYSRLYAPLGWIISTGFYTDHIEHSIAAKEADVAKQIRQVSIAIVGITILILVTGLTISFYFSTRLTQAIITIKEKLSQLARGEQTEEVSSSRKDEVGDMTTSLNSLVKGLRSYTSFAKEIGKGNLVQTFEPLSKSDILGNELLDMRNNLKKAADEKSVRDWVNEGMAQMGEVLRGHSGDTRELAHEIIKSLIKYLKANQGALFLTVLGDREEDAYLEQAATYAYDRKKFMSKKVEMGEGLVGQCVLEKATIHMVDIPKNYVAITSGLGEALPETILIVPLIHNEEVYGVIEIASFSRLRPHEIRFVEKVAESIASTVSTVQINERTKRLLEQSQQMAEELKAQEEELRQNQEELQATQEQMRRRQVELERENEMLKREKSVIIETKMIGQLPAEAWTNKSF
ncbi:MAG TPA: cache domain-containing protein [Ohtaekwangia sp.]|uniref:cache domain-containing protein n=1 Tax=Ohtaekwangia sp. TaxID=2066019 RepID=UPI002F92F584